MKEVGRLLILVRNSTVLFNLIYIIEFERLISIQNLTILLELFNLVALN